VRLSKNEGSLLPFFQLLTHSIFLIDIIEAMKTIKVAAAIIEKDKKILIAKRAYGKQAGFWEFPGGKYEDGEIGEETIIREIKEEMNIGIEVKRLLCSIEHEYEDFDLQMDCYLCQLKDKDMSLHDHSAIRWIDPREEIDHLLAADRKVLEIYRKEIRHG